MSIIDSVLVFCPTPTMQSVQNTCESRQIRDGSGNSRKTDEISRDKSCKHIGPGKLH